MRAPLDWAADADRLRLLRRRQVLLKQIAMLASSVVSGAHIQAETEVWEDVLRLRAALQEWERDHAA